ncbi:MAG: ABC transporter substrate-binding protein [Alphaproteobacteria bacterium]|nr:ABC transporter substrate-binding protein [Alphaproteobacteria bacterium]
MRRRDVLRILALMASASPVRAQAGPARVAFLTGGSPEGSAILLEAFKQGLANAGLVEGQNCVLDVRWANGHYERFPALAAELAERHPEVIVVTTIAAARSAQRLTPPVPVVMTGLINPIGAGLIESLSRPGGNTTGVADLVEEFSPKLLEFVNAIVPKARVFGALFNPANPESVKLLEDARTRAGSINAIIEPAAYRSTEELAVIFAELALKRPDALLIITDITFLDLRAQIAQLALRHRLPAFSTIPELTKAGALIGYGPPRRDLYRRAAAYVKKILDGTKPADLPVEQPTRIELSVNLQTAKALGLTVPPTLLARADEVIE